MKVVARYAKSAFPGHQLCKEVIPGPPSGADRELVRLNHPGPWLVVQT